MPYDIVPASEIAKLGSRNKGEVKYPWDKLQINQSFIIPCGEIQLISIQSGAYKAGKRLNKKFGVTDHGERGIEVTRLTDPVEQQENKMPAVRPAKQNGFPESFDATKHSVGIIEAPRQVKVIEPVAEEPWKSPILDPRINLANVVKRIEVSVEAETRNEPEKSEWVLPKKEKGNEENGL